MLAAFLVRLDVVNSLFSLFSALIAYDGDSTRYALCEKIEIIGCAGGGTV